MYFKRFLGMFVLGILFIASPVLAAEVIEPKGESGSVIVSGDEELIDDVYTAGGNVTVDRALGGDLFAAGGALNVSGTIAGDLFLAGGSVVVSDAVTGDARIAGGNITINSRIEEDLLITGGTVTIAENASVGGDLWVAGGNVIVNGDIDGDVKIRSGEIILNSTIPGAVDVEAERLSFGSEAVVSGSIVYRGENEPVIEEGAEVADVDYTEMDVKQPNPVKEMISFSVLGFIINLIAWLLAALLLYKFFGKSLDALVEVAVRSPGKSLGIGFVGMVIAPIVILLLFVTVIGYYIAFIALFWFILMMLTAGLLACILLGSVLMKWFKKQENVTVTWQSVVLGVVLFSIFRVIPVIGWIANLLLVIIAFGAILQAGYVRMLTRKE